MALFSTIFHKNRRVLSLISAIILLLLVSFSRGEVRPFLGYLSSTIFYSPFYRFKVNVENFRNAAEENRRLKNQLAESALQLSLLNETRRENQRLRELIGFAPPQDFHLVPVKVVSLLQHFYPISAVINKGSDDGIRENQAVVNRFGLVGKIKEVMPRYATVQLLTDPSNPISGRVARSRQIGIVKFSPDRGMYLDNLPADAEIKKGDLVTSSGLGGIYPPGLAIAVVDSVLPNTGEILKNVRLRPTVDFFEIDELYILSEADR
ncbi:putative Cell shape-determining protein MreC [Candidatus Zixiibacteriota bacterium]|nr:putative Cell shape-determining protein MreC [candidate division Zixibacteria bacterium]